MPKKTAQEVIQDITALDISTQNVSMAEKFIAYASEVENPESAEETELQGLRQTIDYYKKADQNKLLADDSAARLFNLSNALLQQGVIYKFEAGIKKDKIKEKILQGQYPGTEFLLEDELTEEKVDKLANNIFIAENPDLVKKIKGHELAVKVLGEQLNGYNCNTAVEEIQDNQKREVLKVVSFNDLVEQYKMSNADVAINKYYAPNANKKDAYMGINSENLTIDNEGGFVINPEYKPGDKVEDLFSQQPKAVEDYIACETREDYLKEREASEIKKDACDKYIENTNILAKNARAMLKELDAIERTDGKEDSKEYTEMRDALEKLANLDQPRMNGEGEAEEASYVPADVLDAIDTLSTSAAAYQKKNDHIYKKNEFGKERVDMSKRLQTLCAIARPVMQPEKYKGLLGENVSMKDIKAEENEKIARIEAARKKKGFEEFEPHKKYVPTVEDRLRTAKKNAADASLGIKGGSSEFGKAVNSFDKVAELYKKLKEVKEDTSLTNNQRRTELSKITKELVQNKKLMNGYIARKKKKGQIQVGSTADLKSQKRINAVNSGIGIVNTIEKEINELYKNMELQEDTLEANDIATMMDNNAAINVTQDTAKFRTVQDIKSLAAKEQKDSYMALAAKYAQAALVKLSNLSKNNPQAPFTPADKQEALTAITAITYYDMLQDLDKNNVNTINRATDDVLQGHLNRFRSSDNLKWIFGDGSGINREQVEDFLADPGYIKKRIIANRDKVNQLKEQAEQNNRINNIQDPNLRQNIKGLGSIH